MFSIPKPTVTSLDLLEGLKSIFGPMLLIYQAKEIGIRATENVARERSMFIL